MEISTVIIKVIGTVLCSIMNFIIRTVLTIVISTETQYGYKFFTSTVMIMIISTKLSTEIISVLTF